MVQLVPPAHAIAHAHGCQIHMQIHLARTITCMPRSHRAISIVIDISDTDIDQHLHLQTIPRASADGDRPLQPCPTAQRLHVIRTQP